MKQPAAGNENLFRRLYDQMTAFKLDANAFLGAGNGIDLSVLFDFLSEYSRFRDALRERLGFELFREKRFFIIIANDVDPLFQDAAGRIWIDRSDFDAKAHEISQMRPDMDMASIRDLILTATVAFVEKKPHPPETEAKDSRRGPANAFYVVKLAKRAAQFASFARVYAQDAAERAADSGNAVVSEHVAAAQAAMRSAEKSAEKAARAASAAVKAENVAAAVAAAVSEAEGALRITSGFAQNALDAAKCVMDAVNTGIAPAPADQDTEDASFFDSMSDCVKATNRAADRSHRFATYARTYIQMAAVKQKKADAGQCAAHFAQVAAQAAAQAMLAADEARVIALWARKSDSLSDVEKTRIENTLREAEQKARYALDNAVDAAAHTGEVVIGSRDDALCGDSRQGNCK